MAISFPMMNVSRSSIEICKDLLLELNSIGKLDRASDLFVKHDLTDLPTSWQALSRGNQKPGTDDWTTWLLLGGRGSGKTRAGAEWVKGLATGNLFYGGQRYGHFALVGETYADAREVMVEGESGLLAIHANGERPEWQSTRKRLKWANGAVAQLFSSEDPDALRGPQFSAAWCDEASKWNHAEETWNMLQFGLRLGDFPRQVVTTTPKPTPLLKKLIGDKRTVVSRMKTDENQPNLAQGFFDRIVENYRGTRLGRQELDGELIEERVDALWQRELIERQRTATQPSLARIVIAVDPPITGKASSDACGIVVAGRAENGRSYVLADRSMNAVSPAKWSAMVVELYKRHNADCVVIETNQGGDMAESVLRNVDPNLPIRQVKASRGKWLRAEPVAHLYERGLVSHVGPLPELEDEMCDFGLEGLSSGKSPDRLDALVWAITSLMLDDSGIPRARTL